MFRGRFTFDDGDIVATIQGVQDVVIRSAMDQVLMLQRGPGTGKSAVALHRAAFLLFQHRAQLAREGVLVVGPNRAFLDYISNVLPSLGERTVRQGTSTTCASPGSSSPAKTTPTRPAGKGWLIGWSTWSNARSQRSRRRQRTSSSPTVSATMSSRVARSPSGSPLRRVVWFPSTSDESV